MNPAGSDGLLAANPGLLGVQAVAVVVTVAYSGGLTWLLLKGLNLVSPARSDDEHEHEGLDLVDHGVKGYHDLI